MSSHSLSSPSSQAHQWFLDHQDWLEQATQAWTTKTAYTPFTESPHPKHHPPSAQARGKINFQARLNRSYHFTVPFSQRFESHICQWVGHEIDPYTQKPLGILYPSYTPSLYLDDAQEAASHWNQLTLEEKMGICLEILNRWHMHVFENAYLTQHTTGQGFMLAFAGSGASALERGLEALAVAWLALSPLSTSAEYQKSFGRQRTPVYLHKRYQRRPLGQALIFTCASYPSWNAYPALLANLITGNTALIKPHPETILPVAFMVDLAQQVLLEAGQKQGCLHLIVDDESHQKTQYVMNDHRVKIIDFTGGRDFGLSLENRQPRYQVFTETAGCNSVLLHSTYDLKSTLDALAFSLCLFSAQMCTAPQNVWISQEGVLEIKDGVQRRYTVDEVGVLLIQALDVYLDSPKKVSALCAALQSKRVESEIQRVAQAIKETPQGVILKDSSPYSHTEFPQARTSTPLLVQLSSHQRKLAQQECFGPISFLIVAPSFDEALQGACSDAQHYGAIASYAYCIDEALLDQIESAYWNHGASIGFNLHNQRPLNYTAAFSDFHVTGLNPAGNACLTDFSFILNRTRQVQSKRERQAPP